MTLAYTAQVARAIPAYGSRFSMATKHVEIVRAEGERGVRDASLHARTHNNAQAEIAPWMARSG